MSEIADQPKEKPHRGNKYIPHVAEFYFKPDFDWTRSEALSAYLASGHPMNEVITYENCIQGLQTLPPASIDLFICDPPFALQFNGKASFYNRDASKVADGYMEVVPELYGPFSRAWIKELPRVMKDTASAYIFSGWTNLRDILNAIEETPLKVLNHVTWHYNFPTFTKNKYASAHYHVLFCVKSLRHYFYNRIEYYVDDVWDIKRKYSPHQEKNGTKLPEKLVQRCIDFSSRPGDLVCDPFLGNGTTAIVAKGNFRHFCGWELNTKMQSIIEKNLAQKTLGQDFSPYGERIDSIEFLSLKYPRAYKEYLRRQAQEKVFL